MVPKHLNMKFRVAAFMLMPYQQVDNYFGAPQNWGIGLHVLHAEN